MDDTKVLDKLDFECCDVDNVIAGRYLVLAVEAAFRAELLDFFEVHDTFLSV